MNDLELIKQQTGCSTREARNALRECNGDIINAIMFLYNPTSTKGSGHFPQVVTIRHFDKVIISKEGYKVEYHDEVKNE